MTEIIRGSHQYKIRLGAEGPSRRAKTKSLHYEITVPSNVAELVKDQLFSCELTEEGILFRPVGKVTTMRVPKWVTGVHGPDNSIDPSRTTDN